MEARRLLEAKAAVTPKSSLFLRVKTQTTLHAAAQGTDQCSQPPFVFLRADRIVLRALPYLALAEPSGRACPTGRVLFSSRSIK